MNLSSFCRLLPAVAIGAALMPCTGFAGLIQHPFNSFTSTQIASLSTVNSISITNDGAPLGSRVYFGKLDLNNNDLIVTATNKSMALSNLANITDMVRAGRNGGDWAGTGITSGVVRLDHSEGYGITALGVILNDDGSGINADGSGNLIWGGSNSLFGSFDGYSTIGGVALSQYDVIVKYTFAGDIYLEGSVEGWEPGFVSANLGIGKGWANGESNYTGGVVSSFDVYEANHSFARQSQYPLVTPVTPDPPFAPEPSSLVLGVCGLVGLLTFHSVRAKAESIHQG